MVVVESNGSVARSSDVDGLRPGADVARPATTASQSSAYIQQIVGCVFGGALALSLLVVTALVLCRRGRRGRRRAAVSKATAAAAAVGSRSSTSTFRLFGGPATSMTRDDSVTLTSTGKTTSNGLSSFSNCSVSAAGGADNDDDDDYDATTLARCFRLPHDVIQTRQLPTPPPPPPHMPSPYQPHYLTGLYFFS